MLESSGSAKVHYNPSLGHRPDTNGSGSPSGHVMLNPKRSGGCLTSRPQLRTKCATNLIVQAQDHISWPRHVASTDCTGLIPLRGR